MVNINSALNLQNGDILLGGKIFYDDNKTITSLYIKISTDIPFGKKKIREFNE